MGISYNGHYWDVTKTETAWVLSFQRKGRMYPTTETVPFTEAATIEEAVNVLNARDLAKAEAERVAYHAQQAKANGAPAPAAVPTLQTWLTARAPGYAPTGTTPAHVASGTGRCRTCRRAGSSWNAGAGGFLCERHWDEY